MRTTSRVPPAPPVTGRDRPTPIRWRTVRVAGLRLCARHAAGDEAAGRTPVVLVHGLGVSGRYFEPLARALAPCHAVWVPDLPGHGRSDHARRPLDVVGLAAALEGWMDAVGVGRALLVGQSLGCQVVAELAARRPARAAALLLLAPTPDPGARAPLRVLLRLLADVPRERPSLVPVVAGDYLRAGPRVILAEYRAMLAHRLEEALRRVREHGVGCAVVRGAGDPVVGAAWAAAVARAAGAPPPVVVPGAGHAAHHRRPALVAAIVREMAAERRVGTLRRASE